MNKGRLVNMNMHLMIGVQCIWKIDFVELNFGP